MRDGRIVCDPKDPKGKPKSTKACKQVEHRLPSPKIQNRRRERKCHDPPRTSSTPAENPGARVFMAWKPAHQNTVDARDHPALAQTHENSHNHQSYQRLGYW